MAVDDMHTASAGMTFTGRRRDLFGLLFRGYLLMLPTIGIYRFWQTTWKRRFYWQNTEIDGDPLEYDGHAVQLLIGFLFALAFFLPIYAGFFFLSTQSSSVTLLGYLLVGTVLWFLSGYAIYRARDFRLSRTLWRGIRFDQKGNAWAYALRRFLWSLLMTITAGLVYPFMAGSLWKYRYSHSWYGDRRFGFAGTWRLIAGAYYGAYLINAATIGGTLIYMVSARAFMTLDGQVVPDVSVWALGFADALILTWTVCSYRAREVSRMFSTVSLGDARLTVKLAGRNLFGQILLYALAFIGVLVVFGLLILILAATLFGSVLAAGGTPDASTIGRLLQSGWINVVLIILVYLALVSSFALMAEVIMGYGFWTLLVRGASIANAGSLKSVRGSGEDPSLIGEGLADALNVGAY